MQLRIVLPLALICSIPALPAGAQPSQPRWRVGGDTQVSLRGRPDGLAATGVVIDSLIAAQWDDGLQIVARPVSRGRLDGSWHHALYQLGVRYHPPTRFPLRVEAGFLPPVFGLGLQRSRALERDTGGLHPQDLRAIPGFEKGLPRLKSVSASYPLAAVAVLGVSRVDIRLGVADGSPTRSRGVMRSTNPPRAPQLVVGAGVTPITGLRIGMTVVSGDYLRADEAPDPSRGGRRATVSGAELEYEFGHTSIVAEWIRASFDTSGAAAIASSGFVLVTHALSPRWRVGGRYDVATTPDASRVFAPDLGSLRLVEGLVAYRVTRELVLRGFVVAQHSFQSSEWDHEAGLSLAVSHRWW